MNRLQQQPIGMLVNHLAKQHPNIPIESIPELNLPILEIQRNYHCQYCHKVRLSPPPHHPYHPYPAIPITPTPPSLSPPPLQLHTLSLSVLS